MQALLGDYAFAGGQAEKQAIEQAIEDVVGAMNPLFRGIARKRLRASNKVSNRLAITADGRKVTVHYDKRHYTAVLGAPSIEVVGVTGNRLQLRHRLKGRALLQLFEGSKGGRSNEIHHAERTLVMDVTVHSDSLPKDLKYRLTYRKK